MMASVKEIIGVAIEFPAAAGDFSLGLPIRGKPKSTG